MRIARMAVTDGFSFTPGQAEKAVKLFLAKLDGNVDWITASGCFLGGKWPASGDSVPTGWESRKEDEAEVHGYGDPLAERMMTPSLRKALKARAKYFSFGIDLKEREGEKIGKHAELVFVWDCRKERVLRRTGKSYPCGSGAHDQTNTLFHTVSYGTHFLRACGERIMVLGCNDLNMWNPRIEGALREGTPRWNRLREFRKAAEEFAPTVVLQHPHFSDTHNIWYAKWIALRKSLDPKSFSSAICYGRWPDKKKGNLPVRGTLEDVLAKSRGGCAPGETKLGNSAWPIRDIVVSHRELGRAA